MVVFTKDANQETFYFSATPSDCLLTQDRPDYSLCMSFGKGGNETDGANTHHSTASPTKLSIAICMDAMHRQPALVKYTDGSRILLKGEKRPGL